VHPNPNMTTDTSWAERTRVSSLVSRATATACTHFDAHCDSGALRRLPIRLLAGILRGARVSEADRDMASLGRLERRVLDTAVASGGGAELLDAVRWHQLDDATHTEKRVHAKRMAVPPTEAYAGRRQRAPDSACVICRDELVEPCIVCECMFDVTSPRRQACLEVEGVCGHWYHACCISAFTSRHQGTGNPCLMCGEPWALFPK